VQVEAARREFADAEITEVEHIIEVNVWSQLYRQRGEGDEQRQESDAIRDISAPAKLLESLGETYPETIEGKEALLQRVTSGDMRKSIAAKIVEMRSEGAGDPWWRGA
jgi:hypothetical protein